MIWWWHHCKRQLATHNLLKNHNKIISGYKLFVYLCLVAEVLSVSSCQMLEKNGFDLIPTVQPVMLSNAHRFFAIRQKNAAIVVIS